jgi:hypothetical protein
MYSSTLSLTSPLDRVGGQSHIPAALPSGKRPGTLLYRRLGGPQAQSGQVRKISYPPGFDPWTAQTVGSSYTVCAMPNHTHIQRVQVVKLPELKLTIHLNLMSRLIKLEDITAFSRYTFIWCTGTLLTLH